MTSQIPRLYPLVQVNQAMKQCFLLNRKLHLSIREYKLQVDRSTLMNILKHQGDLHMLPVKILNSFHQSFYGQILNFRVLHRHASDETKH